MTDGVSWAEAKELASSQTRSIVEGGRVSDEEVVVVSRCDVGGLYYSAKHMVVFIRLLRKHKPLRGYIWTGPPMLIWAGAVLIAIPLT